ncbi:MAG: helix-turn-helix transcriptional regulator [Methylobacter sp.]
MQQTTNTSVNALNQANFNSLPATGFLRIWQIIGDEELGIPPLLPISRSTFLARVKDGSYPKPVSLGARSVAWRVEDIKALIEEIGGTTKIRE